MKLVNHFLGPLLSQIRRNNHKQPTLTLCPSLRQEKTRLDGLPEANLIGEDDAARKGIAQGEERCIQLVRVEVHLGVGERPGKTVDTAACRSLCELVSKIESMVRG